MKRKWLKLGCIAFAMLALVAAGLCFRYPDMKSLRESPANPETGVWYSVRPEGAVSADGSSWHGRIRFGTENKLMLYFLGGGVSLDEYSAARSYTAVGGDAFYFDRDDGVSGRRVEGGIAGNGVQNPFRNWTVAVFPYTTGDFHAGAGEAGYTDLKGKDAVIHHNGYRNYAAMLDAILPMVCTPDALMIAGYSAGGFGAAMLADDIMDHFPDVENVTVCVDGALLLHPDWRGIAENRWHAPEMILERTVSDNLTLDHLKALHASRGEGVKILFTSSTRDGALAMYQSYMDGGVYAAVEEYGDVYKKHLQDMVQALEQDVSEAGIYIWELPYAQGSTLTRHTILTNDAVFRPMDSGVSIAQWMLDAAEGQVKSYGLELLG